MAIAVQNISATSARVSWPAAPGCLDTFYSVMYHPNWNSLLMGYTRKSFLREDRVPVSQTSAQLANLTPQTTYILCVTCQAANPARDQCQVFSTLGEGGGDAGRDVAGWELAMCVWMASSILLLVIAGVLLWSCLYSICPFPGRPDEGYPGASALPQTGGQGSPGCLYAPGSSEEDAKPATVIENPFHQAPAPGRRDGQDHELRTLSQQRCDGEPV